jgi:hypothetical protein
LAARTQRVVVRVRSNAAANTMETISVRPVPSFDQATGANINLSRDGEALLPGCVTGRPK